MLWCTITVTIVFRGPSSGGPSSSDRVTILFTELLFELEVYFVMRVNEYAKPELIKFNI